jgi:hypothetical protein
VAGAALACAATCHSPEHASCISIVDIYESWSWIGFVGEFSDLSAIDATTLNVKDTATVGLQTFVSRLLHA